MNLARQLEHHFSLKDAHFKRLNILVNDLVVVTTSSGKYALKIYNAQSRTIKDVEWELNLIEHLLKHGAPVVRPVRGRRDYVEAFVIDGQERAAALFEWLPGEKPQPSRETYVLLGETAARIHAASDTFHPTWMRDTYDAHTLIDEQIELMKKHLVEARRYDDMLALGERLKTLVADLRLDQGICHMDLTLDNIHLHDGKLTVFDFDSAGYCWRAMEPYGVLRFSNDYFNDWLKGYRAIRPFSEGDERAVYAFAVIGDIRNVVWKLGEAKSSRGEPLLTVKDLPKIVDEYLEWERKEINEPRTAVANR
jgi:Ser/Thr protein kinase RdoA (MazF antagonist)